MIAVADSGSTKTDWRLYDRLHGVQEIQTTGLNPYFLSAKEITNVLKKDLHPYFNNEGVSLVFFYGSGCSHDDKIMEVESALSDFFPNARISVESDLLGTARALCGSDPGIVAILGTGSNSCIYNGNNITGQILSLGYILGDEGSGAVLGKTLLKAALSGSMPLDLLEKFLVAFPAKPDAVLERIYRQPFPNRYLASHVPFAVEHMNHEWMHDQLKRHLHGFFEQMVAVYEDFSHYTLNISGSLAWHLKPLLLELCTEYGIRPGKILQKPIDDLLAYHLRHLAE